MDFIYRQHPTTDESPPWAGIAFKLPIDSDILAEKLRSAYPERRTLRERKHQATIDFFMGELSQMQSKDSPTITIAKPFGAVISGPPPYTSTVFSSPVPTHSRPQTASGCTSPSFKETSSSPRPIEYFKPTVSLAPSTSFQPPTTTSTTSSSQFVWNAHDGRAARPKTKRKMTIEERSAYKETRKRGACSKCRKQKGKCTHMVEGDRQTSPDESSKSVKRCVVFILKFTANLHPQENFRHH
ncbi:hypothetical protein DM02DRAFT_268172 [Periconia macrospinosa]|uniref:Uncharacterized protein n=1 Tax=Periconia macrospinosa TaxID=97972 RepID=A0A2V1DZ04_9PLEO|nr:hypothetical protein DM02DRAFT_268172 [Periconia macrospinosa]